MATRDLIRELRRAIGAAAVRDDPASTMVYARDASHQVSGRPACVALPATIDDLGRVIAVCARHGRSFVVRGGGTGLAGGALPSGGAVVIATSRLTRLGEVDAEWRHVRVEPGVFNAAVSREAAAYGLCFAPDPSSQSAATIGGNIATNAGGPHCLKVGVTSQHVRRVEWFDPEGRRWASGRGCALDRGPDLRGLFCGSEGTLGVICNADLELCPLPESTATLLAEFPRLREAAGAVIDLARARIEPQACEIIDQTMLEAVAKAFEFPLATDIEAVMICELAGAAGAVDVDAARAGHALRAAGARRVEVGRDTASRERLWQCRKHAFGAVGRLSPSYISQDVVVPLEALPELVGDIEAIRRDQRVTIATAWHAGDGNLHPGIHFDDRDPDAAARARQAADAISLRAIALGGSCTGEHGIGLEKRHLIGRQLDRTALRLMQGIKDLCDPTGICNPGKVLPPPGDGTAAQPVPVRVDFRWESLTVTAPADVPLAVLQGEAMTRGYWIPVGAAYRGRVAAPGLGGDLTVGAMIDAGTTGPSLLGSLRPTDAVLALWAESGDGEVFRAGTATLKDVAGYDLVRLLVGSGGMLAKPLAASLRLRPLPTAVGIWSWPDVPPFFPSACRREFMGVLRRHEHPALAVRSPHLDGSLLWVLAAGYGRGGDLDRLQADLETWSEDHGLARPHGGRDAFAVVGRASLLAGLPTWAVAAPDWTLLTRRETLPDWPRPRRLIWQAQPEMLWMPEAPAEEPVGWIADNVFRDGKLQWPPPPPPSVPYHLLAGLKRLFDPHLRLPCPGWLQAILTEAAR